MQGLEYELGVESASAEQSLQKLSDTLSKLRTALRGSTTGASTAAKHIQQIGEAAKSLNASSVSSLKSIADALKQFQSIGNIRISSSIPKQISGIADAASKLNFSDTFAIRNLAESLAPFGSLQSSKLTSYINQLRRIPELAKQLNDADIEKFAAQMERLGRALKPFADEMFKVGQGFSAMPSKIQRLIRSTEQYNNVTRKATGVSAKLDRILSGMSWAKMTVTMSLLGRMMGTFTAKSVSFQENMNLFEASMGRFTESALEFGQKASDILGLDLSDWMRNQGIFQTLLTGFGMVEERAAVMSKNLTQLGYDLSSFFNVSVSDAMQKVQSGIAGELEPLRRFGFDLSQAKLQAIAAENGITKLVSGMTQAEKAELRYYAVMTQVTVAHGDMARTLEAPANQLRILRAQFEMAGRAIGNIFIPALNAILPYAIAALQVIREIADAIASLFGFEMVEIDYSGIDRGSAGAGALSENLDKAGEAAKKLKQYTAGFDELNVFAPPQSAGGAGAGGGGGGLGLEPPGYDFLKDAVSKNLDKVKDKLKSLIPIIATIGAGAAAWKLSGILKDASLWSKKLGVSLSESVVKRLKMTIGVSSAVAGSFLEVKGVWDAFQNDLDGGNTVQILGGMGMVIGGLGLAFGPTVAAIGGAVASVGALSAAFDDMWKNGLNFNNVALITAAGGAFVTLGMVIGPLPALLAAIAGAFTAGAIALSRDAIPAFELFDETISETTQSKVGPFIDQMRELDDTMKNLEWSGSIVSDETVSDVKSKTAKIRETILNELDSDRNAALANLSPLKKAMGDEAFSALIKKNQKFYDDRAQQVKEGEKRINEIMDAARAEGRALEQSDLEEIASIRKEMQDIGVHQLSETEIEYSTIMQRLTDGAKRMSADQAISILQDAMNTKEGVIQSAREQYAGVEIEAQRMLEAGTITRDEYDAIMQKAVETRDSTISDAEAQYDGIVDAAKRGMGETANQIDFANLEIKSRWDVFSDEMDIKWNEFWENRKKGWNKFKDWVKTDVFPKLTKEYWSEKFKGIADGLKQSVKSGVNGAIANINSLADWVNSKLHISFGGYSIKGHQIIPAIDLQLFTLPHIPMFAEGGFPDAGSLFIANEAGPEFVGSIGGRTAVANNDQIVESVTAGVENANAGVIAAIYALIDAVESKEMTVNIGDDEIGSSYDRYERSRGARLNQGAFANAY